MQVIIVYLETHFIETWYRTCCFIKSYNNSGIHFLLTIVVNTHNIRNSQNILFCTTSISIVSPIGNIIPNWSISYTTTVNYKLSVFRKLVQNPEIANMTLSIQMMVPSALPRRHYAEEKDGAAAGLIMKHVNDLMSSICEPQWLTKSTSNN